MDRNSPGALDNGPMATRVSSPMFVGRQGELADVRAAVRTASAGQPTVVLVAGEAGVGKTRFIAEATRTLPPTVRVLAGGCIDIAGGTVPFAPVIEALRGLARGLPEGELHRLAGPGRADLARLLPQLRRPGTAAAGTGLAYGSAQGRLFEAVLGLLDRLAATGPTVLVIEDIHWADRSTLDLLAFLVRNLRQGPILLLASFRSDELHRRHPLVPFLAELSRSRPIVRIDLARFDRREVADQLAAIVGRPPAPELVELVYSRSEGNPFFAEELLAAGGSSAGRVPDTLREVLAARIAALSESTQELLRIAVAAGTRVQANLLGAIAGVDDPALVRALREAVEHQILLPEEDGPTSRYRFRHTLVREAVYADLLPAERTRLHARFATVLEELPTADRDASTAAEIAYHWYAAHDLGRALEASVRAGIAAESAWAFAEAQVQYERALELWDRVPDAGERVEMDRVDLLARAAAAAATGAVPRAVAHIREAIALVDPGSDPERAGLLHSRLSRFSWLAGDGRGALEAAREAVRLVPADPPTVARARVTAALGQVLMVEGYFEESRPISEEAVRVARAVDVREVEGHALNTLGADLGYLGDFAGGLEKLEQALDIARHVGNVDDVARAYVNIIDLHNAAGRYDGAAQLAADAFDYDGRHGLARFYGAATLCEGALALGRLGRWTEADAVLTRLDRYQLSGNPEIFVSERLAALEVGRGEFGVARRRLDQVAGLLHNAVDPQWTAPFAELNAELSLWQDHPSDAASVIADRLDVLSRLSLIVAGQIGRLGPLYGLGLRAEADLAALARVRHADREVLDIVERGRAYLGTMRSLHEEIRQRLPTFVPLADGYLALCEAEESRLEGTPDPRPWEAAAHAWGQLGMRPARAYPLWRQAQAILGATRARVAAAPLLRDAHAIAVDVGAHPLRHRIEALAGRGRIQLETPSSGGTAPGPESVRFRLTPREREVLELVAAGQTNRQIAESLFIGEKTAGVHVSNILAKLEAGGRTEAVAIARRVGILAEPRSN